MTINYYPGRKIFGSSGICFDRMIEELDRPGRAPRQRCIFASCTDALWEHLMSKGNRAIG